MPASPQRRHGRSSLTQDRKLPGAFEGETVSRRRFMTGTAHIAGAIAAAAVALPALGFAIGPVFDRASDSWQRIGPLSRFTAVDYTPTLITIEPGIGEPVCRSRTSAGTTRGSMDRSKTDMTS